MQLFGCQLLRYPPKEAYSDLHPRFQKAEAWESRLGFLRLQGMSLAVPVLREVR